MARRLGRIDIVSHALSTQSLADLFDSAEMNALYEESIAAAERARSPINLIRCYANGGVVNWYALRFREALALSDRAISIAYETDTTEQVEFHQGFRVHQLDRLGEWDEALATARDVLARPLESASPAIMLRLSVSRIAIRRGETDGAEDLDTMMTLLGDEEDARHVCDVAALVAERAWLGLEDPGRAQAFVDQALAQPIGPMLMEELLDWQRRLDPARLPEVLDGLHAPYRVAMDGDWSTAAAEWRRIGDPYREALSLAEGDAGDVARAAALLDRLGATRVREHVLRSARAQGLAVEAPPRPRASTRANPAGLTRRQMEVLGLLSDGLSNAQIGARLHVAPKTVDHHVSAILGKLGVASRGEAAAVARDAGWLAGP
jgi:DNA-binding CsgD family transcriptional regulator